MRKLINLSLFIHILLQICTFSHHDAQKDTLWRNSTFFHTLITYLKESFKWMNHFCSLQCTDLYFCAQLSSLFSYIAWINERTLRHLIREQATTSCLWMICWLTKWEGYLVHSVRYLVQNKYVKLLLTEHKMKDNKTWFWTKWLSEWYKWLTHNTQQDTQLSPPTDIT